MPNRTLFDLSHKKEIVNIQYTITYLFRIYMQTLRPAVNKSRSVVFSIIISNYYFGYMYFNAGMIKKYLYDFMQFHSNRFY